MKTSEAIAKLQEIQNEHGDLDVLTCFEVQGCRSATDAKEISLATCAGEPFKKAVIYQ